MGHTTDAIQERPHRHRLLDQMVFTPASHEGSPTTNTIDRRRHPSQEGFLLVTSLCLLAACTAGCGAGPFAALPPGQRPVRIASTDEQSMSSVNTYLRFGCSFTIRWLDHASENRKYEWSWQTIATVEQSLHTANVEPLRMREDRLPRGNRPHMGIVTQHSECDPRRETPGTRSQRDRSGTDPAPTRSLSFFRETAASGSAWSSS